MSRRNAGKLLSGGFRTFWKCLGLILGGYFLEVSGVNPEKILLDVSRSNPGKVLSGGLWTFWKCLGLILGRYFLEVSGVDP